MKTKLFLAVLCILFTACSQNKNTGSQEMNEDAIDNDQELSEERAWESDGSGVIAFTDNDIWYVDSAEGVNLRQQPATTSKIIISVPDNYPVKILGHTEDKVVIGGNSNYWYQAVVNEKTGWLFGELISSRPKDFNVLAETKGITLYSPKVITEQREYQGLYRFFTILNGNFDLNNKRLVSLSDISLSISYTPDKDEMVVRCNFPKTINRSFNTRFFLADEYGIPLITAGGTEAGYGLNLYFTDKGIILWYNEDFYQCNMIMAENKPIDTDFVLQKDEKQGSKQQ